MNNCLAFDVGGANLKAANAHGYTASRPFALWKSPDRLADELASMIAAAPECQKIAATMTGELADCFATKRDGVRSIVQALSSSAEGRELAIYLVDGTFASPEQACEQHHLAAAANWHALATFAAQLTNQRDTLLIDIGSTTCDVVPISNGEVVAHGNSDTERLLAHELIYIGIERTPICAITSAVPYRGRECPVAREVFATTLDVHLLTNQIAERPGDCNTADGRPATCEFALARLARCICADESEFNLEDGRSLADYVSFELSELLSDAIEEVSMRHRFNGKTQLILSGHGDFLLPRSEYGPGQIISLSETIGPEQARCGPAFAVANLAERLG